MMNRGYLRREPSEKETKRILNSARSSRVAKTGKLFFFPPQKMAADYIKSTVCGVEVKGMWKPNTRDGKR